MLSPTEKGHQSPEADRTITIGTDHSLMKYNNDDGHDDDGDGDGDDHGDGDDDDG